MSRLKLKTLGLFSSLTSGTIGGVEASARVAWAAISKELNDHHAHLFCYENNRKRFLGSAAEAYAFYPANRLQSKAAAVFSALKTRFPAQLVLVWHLGLLKLLPFFHVPKARIVLFLHGIEAWQYQDLLTRVLMRRVSLFLTCSEHTWQQFISFNPEFAKAPHEVVYLGIDTPLNGPLPFPDEPPAAFMISRLCRDENYKGHREMIAAWPLVLKRIADAELWIAGDGDLLDVLKRTVEALGLANRIRFFGRVSEDEKQNLLMRCRCLALPSRSEGFGLVYLEAMRMGRPCLVSTLDGGREPVAPPEAGLAADPDNQRALTEAVCRLLTAGPEWEQWSIRARQRYDQFFTASHFQERILRSLTAIEI